MPRRSLAVRLLLLLLPVAFVVGCSDEDVPAGGEGDAAPEIAAIESSWTVDIEQYGYLRQLGEVGGRLLVVADETIAALATDTGEPVWEVPLPHLCAAAPSADGSLIAVVTAEAQGAPCRRVGVVDPAAGDWLWRATLPEPMDDTPSSSPSLAAGDTTLTIITRCCYSTALRYDLRTGEQQRTLDPDLTGWGAWAVTDGQSIALVSGLNYDADVRLTLVDADTGKTRWTKRVVELVEENTASTILSSDPLVLLTSERGHAVIRRFDERGRSLGVLGPQYYDTGIPGMRSLGVHDGALVVGLGIGDFAVPPQQGLVAYDLGTGEVRWSGFPRAGGFAGLTPADDAEDPSGDSAPSSAIVVNPTGVLADDRPVVTRHSLADVQEFEVLGALDGVGGARVQTVAGETLYYLHSEGLSAYPLPAEGQDVEVSYPEDLAQAGLATGVADDDPAWEEGDVRPGAIDTCQPPREVLERLGFHQLDLAPTAGCTWQERQEPLGVWRSLEVGYEIGVPNTSTGATATQTARQVLRKLVPKAPFPAGPVGSPAFVEVPGLGDDAYASVLAGPGAYQEVHLVVRVRNVVATVEIRGEADTTDAPGATVDGGVMEEAALDSVAAVIEQAGLTLDGVPTPVASQGEAPQDICRRFDGAARAIVPDGVRLDQRAANDTAGRTGGCYWGEGDDAYVRDDGERVYSAYVKIAAHAVPGSGLLDRNPTQMATAAMAALRKDESVYDEKPRRIRVFGDQALLFPALDSTADGTVVVRIGSTLFQIDVNDQDGLPEAARDDAALRLAEQVVAAYS